jgi:hypothetical protein
LDLIYLNLRLLSTKEIFFLNTSTDLMEPSAQAVPTGLLVVKQDEGCGKECKDEIEKAVSEALAKNNSQAVNSGSLVKEYFVPFGTGHISSTEWADVPGLEAYVDGDAYGRIKKSVFEVSVRVPTGNETAEVRLYNSTRSHPVWNSNVTFTGGGTPQFLVSNPITFDPGTNLYKVQMKTQLQFPAYIDQSRVHITTN